jgi:hypothetical protein
MFADPQSITVNAVAQSLPATARNGTSSVYTKDDQTYQLTIGHQYGNRKRFTVRIDTNKIAADPLASANNQRYSASAYLVIDGPNVGYTNAELRDLALALSSWATSANLLKVLGGET